MKPHAYVLMILLLFSCLMLHGEDKGRIIGRYYLLLCNEGSDVNLIEIDLCGSITPTVCVFTGTKEIASRLHQTLGDPETRRRISIQQVGPATNDTRTEVSRAIINELLVKKDGHDMVEWIEYIYKQPNERLGIPD